MNNEYMHPSDEISSAKETPENITDVSENSIEPNITEAGTESQTANAEAEVTTEVVEPSSESTEVSGITEDLSDKSFDREKVAISEESSQTPTPPYAPHYTQSTSIPAAEPVIQTPPYQMPPYQAPANHAPVYQTANAPGSYNSTSPMPTQPPKKKKGHVAFLVCLFTLIGIFSIGFFVLCGYVVGQGMGSSDLTKPTLFDYFDNNEKETEPASEKEEVPEGVIPLPDSDKEEYSEKGSIELKALPRDKNDTNKYTTQYAYKKVAESTIGVVCYEKGFTGEPSSQGTGIVITEDGYIATNSHVIGDSRTAYSVQVVTNDGTTYEAKVVGYDSRTDLAVLKVNATNLTPAEFCDSDLVEVGIDVIAVGNPGGMDFQNSLTRGVVSALNRELGLSAQVTYIQTDAAINPGNSGGPLSNMYGQVIGITTAKISSESVEGMGFAIPSQTVKEIIDDLMSQGYVSNRVRLGISGQAVSSSMQQFYDLPKGILVGEISEDGPCDNTDLKVNDVITKIDGEEIDDFSDIYAILAKHNPGDKVVLTVYRNETKKTLEITITLMADEGQTQQ